MSYFRWTGVFVLLVLVYSCEPEYEKIPEEQMIDILVDLHIADQIIRQEAMLNRDSVSKELKKSLLKLHNVSEEQLDTNLYLYQFDTEGYRELSKVVVERLKAIREDIAPEEE